MILFIVISLYSYQKEPVRLIRIQLIPAMILTTPAIILFPSSCNINSQTATAFADFCLH